MGSRHRQCGVVPRVTTFELRGVHREGTVVFSVCSKALCFQNGSDNCIGTGALFIVNSLDCQQRWR